MTEDKVYRAMHLEDGGRGSEISSEGFRWHWRLNITILGLSFSYLAGTWALQAPLSAITYIVQDFPAESDRSIWVGAAALVPLATFQSFVGSLTDIFGRRYFICTGPVFGVVGTIVSSRAHSLRMVIGGQVLNGVGISLSYLAFAAAAELVPKDVRPIVQGCIVIVGGFANVCGPIISGTLIRYNAGGELQGWRVSFYIAAGFYLFAFVILVIFYHPARGPKVSKLKYLERVLKIDWLGVLLVTAGIVLFLVGLQSGGNSHPWKSATTLTPLVLGGVLIIVYVLYNSLLRNDGLLHHSLFQHRNYPLGLCLTFISGIILLGGQAIYPQIIAALFTSNPIMTGVYNIPFNASAVLSAMISSMIMAKTKEARPIVVVAMLIAVLGCGLLALEKPGINFAAWFFPDMLTGITSGVALSILYVTVGLCTPNEFIAHALGLNTVLLVTGGTIGTVMLSQILVAKAKNILPAKIAKAVLAAGLSPTELVVFFETALSQNLTALAAVPGVTLQVLDAFEDAYKEGFSEAFHYCSYALIPFAVVGLILSLFLKSTKMQMDHSVVAVLESYQHQHHPDGEIEIRHLEQPGDNSSGAVANPDPEVMSSS